MSAGPVPHPRSDHLDVLVVGSGVAGLSAAVRLAAPHGAHREVFGPPPGRGRSGAGLRVGVLTKGELSQSATRWAQGGVAAVLGGDEDSTDLHLADTLAAGAGLCDVDAVRVLVDEGPSRVHELIGLGAVFDRQPTGAFDLAREGGHSMARVVHAGGAATGAEVERALVDATRSSAAAVLEGWFALDLVVEGGRCVGVRALSASGDQVEVRAAHTVLATGGAGQLFAVTTNPTEATADGLAMALRAGVAVADVEFMQFHPTALHHPAMPRPLLSEALRGHGALLRDARGERFVDELAPRDVVSKAMASRLADQGVEHLWLDATGLEAFDSRFPTIAASLDAIGLDPRRDWLPIAPAAHYLSGGVLTDLAGATVLPGLWAAGEVACTGVHGANRLASNSLLEGMVFGARLSESIQAGRSGPERSGALGALLGGGLDEIGTALAAPWSLPPRSSSRPERSSSGSAAAAPADPTKRRDLLQRSMTEGAGVVRSSRSLSGTGRVLEGLAACPVHSSGRIADRAEGELANLMTVAGALVRAASVRCESRGAHARSDHPRTLGAWRRRVVHLEDRVGLSDHLSGPSATTGSGRS
ncbi:MAG: L-aspartate oxidase [Acidimicrobiales bacterium]